MSDDLRAGDPRDTRSRVIPYVPDRPRDPLDSPVMPPPLDVPDPRGGDARDKRDTRTSNDPNIGYSEFFSFPPGHHDGQLMTGFNKIYQFYEDMGIWFEAGAVPSASTYTFRIGIDETSPGIVDVMPARALPGEIGGINEPSADGNYMRNAAAGIFSWVPAAAGNLTFDTGLTLTGTSVNLDPALPPGGEIGGINEPPADTGLQYTRSYTGGVGLWTQTTAGGYTWGIGLDEVPPGSNNIDLIPATPTVIGGVSVPARSLTQGLDLTVPGVLTAPLATDLLAGAIVEPLPDGLQYVRTRTAAGVSSWVVATTASLIWGIGIDEDLVVPGTIHLQPANFTPGEIGGVVLEVRSLTQGLVLDDVTGLITAPLATDLLAGAIVEPVPSDTILYARKRTLLGVSTWEPVQAGAFVGDAPPPAPNTQGQFWFESDTGKLFVFYDDGNSTQWVQVGGV